MRTPTSIATCALWFVAFGAVSARCEDPKPAPPTPPPAEPAKPDAPPAPPAAPTGPAPVVAEPSDGNTLVVSLATQDTNGPRIGTPPEDYLKLVRGRDKEIQLLVTYETPRHEVALNPYKIDATEVTNAQYLYWLDRTAKTTYKTGSSSLSNLDEIAKHFVGEEKDDVSWSQLYELNKVALNKALPNLAANKSAFRYAALPPDLDVVVYQRRLPPHWFAESGTLDGDAKPDFPVHWISYLDAAAFAAWAGKHIPTEEEWEWAARGPEMRNYPWGEDWTEGVAPNGKRIVEKRCNWLDVKVVNSRQEPTVLAVETLPEGRSWCGCFHMLGNAAEWTSSWFGAYPGWKDPHDGNVEKNPYLLYMGEFAKVIRGGSCGDRDRLVLRLALRNFVGAGRESPPKPENSFRWLGFRCAKYVAAGLDRLEHCVWLLRGPKVVRRENLDPKGFAGAEALHFVPKGTPMKDHVGVTGPAATVLLCTNRALELSEEKQPWAKTPEDVREKSQVQEEYAPVLGLISTDVAIEKAQVPDPREKKAPSGIERDRKKSKPPKVIDGEIPAGTYILSIWHKHIAFFTANLTFVGWLPAEVNPTEKDLKKDDKGVLEPRPASVVDVDEDADLVKCKLWMPYGGKTEWTKGFMLSWSMYAEGGQLKKVAEGGNGWR
jgi:formylglycine-generating enzyme required for sulfatase activity